MNNNLSTYLLIFFVGLSGMMPVVVFAENSRRGHISTGRMLEFSLTNLREGMEKTIQKNKRLVFENDVLRKEIQYLERMLERLIVKKAKLSDDPNESDIQLMQFSEPVEQKDRQKRTQELIEIFEENIAQQKEDINILEGRLDGKQFELQKQSLLLEKKNGLKSIAGLEKRWSKLDVRSRKPYRTVELLQAEKLALERKLDRAVTGADSFYSK